MNWVRDHALQGTDTLSPDTDLMRESVLDSVGFIELVAFLERQTGQGIDLETASAEDLTSIRGLCRLVARARVSPE